MLVYEIHLRTYGSLFYFTFANFKSDYYLFLFCFISITMWLSMYFLLFRKYGFDLVKVNETCYGIFSS